MIVYFIVLTLTWISFGELSILMLLKRALTASMDALTFSIVDSIVSQKRTKKVANESRCCLKDRFIILNVFFHRSMAIGCIHLLHWYFSQSG